MGENDRRPWLPGSILLTAGLLTIPAAAMVPADSLEEEGTGHEELAGHRTEPALGPGLLAVKVAHPARAEPSWSRILATTIKLSAGRRIRRLAPRRRRLTAFFLVMTVVVAAALAVTCVFAGTGSRQETPSSARSAGARVSSAQAAAAKLQADAAAWIASQVSTGAMVACDPVMCAALQAHGVIAGRLVPLRPGAADPVSANIMVTSRPADRQLTEKYAPAVIASFGAAPRIDVRVVAPGGVVAYDAALRADLAARMDAGSQLLQNPRIQFTAQDAARLRAGEVDSRLLATLAALSPVYSFLVTAFGDASPGAQALFRGVTITIRGRGDGRSELTAARALVSVQEPPYVPAHATIIAATADQSALRIEFAAPSPLGLLTTVLTAYSSA